MAWLKLTGGNGSSILLNSDNVKAFESHESFEGITRYYYKDYESGEVKESLEEIEAMLNKNEQHQMVEIVNPDAETVMATVINRVKESVAKEIRRDYIGQHEPQPLNGLDHQGQY